MNCRTLAVALVTAVVLANLIVAAAQTGPPTQGGELTMYSDARCVTGLNPNKCRSVGNAFCNALSEGTGCYAVGCTYCDSGVWMPTHYCVDWYLETCEGRGTESNCDNVQRLTGVCGLIGSCVCANSMPDGTCIGTNIIECFPL